MRVIDNPENVPERVEIARHPDLPPHVLNILMLLRSHRENPLELLLNILHTPVSNHPFITRVHRIGVRNESQLVPCHVKDRDFERYFPLVATILPESLRPIHR